MRWIAVMGKVTLGRFYTGTTSKATVVTIWETHTSRSRRVKDGHEGRGQEKGKERDSDKWKTRQTWSLLGQRLWGRERECVCRCSPPQPDYRK